MLKIEYIPTGKLKIFDRNPRTHTPAQVDQICDSIHAFGWTNPVLIDEHMGIIAGHGRIMAAQKLGINEVPCITLEGLTESDKVAYVIADNNIALNAGWDAKLLSDLAKELDDAGEDVMVLGFDTQELEKLLGKDLSEFEKTESEEIEEVVEDETLVSRLGDVWLLGDHRLMCGDSTKQEDVSVLLDGAKADACHADPPYGMGKEKEGVINDNKYGDKLDLFQAAWWGVARMFLKDNASVYFWGNAPNLWRFWYGFLQGSADNKLVFKNEIVWDKGSTQGQGGDIFRLYPPVTERCLFFMLGAQEYCQNADNYWEGWEPIRAYLKTEADRVGLNNEKIKTVCGCSSMYTHWFGKSQWRFIPEKYYIALRDAYGCFKKEHATLKKEHDEKRAYFDNTHDVMSDVWAFARVQGEERYGHPTPKPVEMMARIMNSSIPHKGLVYEPFSGSGTTIVAAEETGRKCYAMEISSKYVDVAIRRFQKVTGKEARLTSQDGQTFEQVSTARSEAL